MHTLSAWLRLQRSATKLLAKRNGYFIFKAVVPFQLWCCNCRDGKTFWWNMETKPVRPFQLRSLYCVISWWYFTTSDCFALKFWSQLLTIALKKMSIIKRNSFAQKEQSFLFCFINRLIVRSLGTPQYLGKWSECFPKRTVLADKWRGGRSHATSVIPFCVFFYRSGCHWLNWSLWQNILIVLLTLEHKQAKVNHGSLLPL